MGVLRLVNTTLGISIFKGLTARRLYKSFSAKWLMSIHAVYKYNCKGVSLQNYKINIMAMVQNISAIVIS
jgi:hypothetical protein